MIAYICIISLAVLITVLAAIYLDHKLVVKEIERDIKLNFLAEGKLNDLFAELDFFIEQEFAFTLQIPYEGKEVKKITDFEGTLNELNSGVIDSITDTMVERFDYLGVDKDYIYAYITRKNMMMLLLYMKDNGIGGMSSQKSEEEEE